MPYFKNITISKIYLFLITVFFISFAYPSPPLTNITIFLLAGIVIIFKMKNKHRLFHSKRKILFVLYLGIIVSALISSYLFDNSFLTSQTTKVFYFFLIPFVFLEGPCLKNIEIDGVLKKFILSVCLFSLLGILKVLTAYFLGLENKIFYQSYSSYLKIHTTYFALLTTLALYFSLYFSFRKKQRSQNLLIYISATIYLSIVLYFLSVRIAFIAVILVTLIVSIREFIINKNKLSILYILLLTISIATVSISGYSSLRIKNLFTETHNNKSDSENRIVLWKNAICAIENTSSTIFGSGLSNSQKILNTCYRTNNYFGLHSEFNTHNQFLQTWLETGYLGLLILLMLLIVILYKSIKEKNFTMFITLGVLVIFFLTESILERQLGITAFLSFTLILINKNFSQSKTI